MVARGITRIPPSTITTGWDGLATIPYFHQPNTIATELLSNATITTATPGRPLGESREAPTLDHCACATPPAYSTTVMPKCLSGEELTGANPMMITTKKTYLREAAMPLRGRAGNIVSPGKSRQGLSSPKKTTTKMMGRYNQRR